MDGILNINKPPGLTSFDVVARLRRLTGERRVGHAGTLDPAASGVLPVCLGRATRIVEFLMDEAKAYRAEVVLGVVTDTYDATGRVVGRGDPAGITREEVAATLSAFCGVIAQTPPMYSAVKHQGQPLYRLARAGVTVARASRPVQVHRLELVAWQPPVFTLEVECGRGTYIRSLAHDLGQRLGCGASLHSLVRRCCGSFDIDDAVSLPRFEEACRYGYWERLVYPVDVVLRHWATLVVGPANAENIRQGRPPVLPPESDPGPPSAGAAAHRYCRAYTAEGGFLGVLRFDPERGQWQPAKVLCR
ncbi:MAG: tRNA pseudouridine(55) synthase TruB [Chloroflexota bacterium]